LKPGLRPWAQRLFKSFLARNELVAPGIRVILRASPKFHEPAFARFSRYRAAGSYS